MTSPQGPQAQGLLRMQLASLARNNYPWLCPLPQVAGHGLRPPHILKRLLWPALASERLDTWSRPCSQPWGRAGSSDLPLRKTVIFLFKSNLA